MSDEIADILDEVSGQLPAEGAKLRQYIDGLRDQLDAAKQEAQKSIDLMNQTTHLLAWARLGDVTTEMCEEIDAAQVRSYLEGASGWARDDQEWHGNGWIVWGSPESVEQDVANIAAAEGRGEIAVWLDVRAQEVGE